MEQNNDQGALQKEVTSGFNACSTTADVIKGMDLTGKIAIVTGGNTGIGLETTKTLRLCWSPDQQTVNRNINSMTYSMRNFPKVNAH